MPTVTATTTTPREETQISAPATAALFALLFAVTVSVRLLAWYCEPLMVRDGCLYVPMVEAWHSSGNYAGMLSRTSSEFAWIPPFALYLMKGWMQWGVAAELSCRLTALLCGIAIPFIGYGIARTTTGNRKLAWFAAFLFAVHPALVELSIQTLRDGIYLFWGGLAVWAACCGIQRQKPFAWTLAGMFCAAAWMARYEMLEMLLIVPGCLVIACAYRRYTLLRALLHLAIFVAGFLLMLAALNLLMGTSSFILDNYQQYYRSKWDDL